MLQKYKILMFSLMVLIYMSFVLGCDSDKILDNSDKSSEASSPPSRYHVTIVNNSGKTLTIAYDTGGTNIRDVFTNGHSDAHVPMGTGYGLGNDLYAYNRPPIEAKGTGWYAHHTFSYDGEKWIIR